MAESIVWTALPHGLTEQQSLALTVYISPRLEPGESDRSLNRRDMPDFTDWTALAAAADRQFRVWFRVDALGSPVIDLGIFPALPQTFRPELWQAIFAGSDVRSRRVEPIGERPQATFVTHDVFATVRQHYQRAAIATVDPAAPISSDERLFTSITELRDAVLRNDDAPVEWESPRGRRYLVLNRQTALRDATDRANARWEMSHDARLAAGTIDVSSFLSLDAEHVPVTDREPAVQVASMLAAHDLAMLATERLSRKRSDEDRLAANEFHQILASVGGYPELLPLLGLSFELSVPLPLTTELVARGWVQIEPVWSPAPTAASIVPWTAIDLSTNWAASAPDAPSALNGGFLLSSATPVGKLDLVPVDLEGALLKIAGMSAADLQQHDRLPVLRSSGLEIVRAGQGALIHRAALRSARQHDRVHETDAPLEFYAEDLNRGYRIDARIGSNGAWRSLHALTRSFELPGDDRLQLDVEGFVQLGVTTLPGERDDDPETLLVRDTLARWNGWSLSAPRPGRAMGDGGLPVDSGAASNLRQLAIRQRVREGTLPRLRFGRRYQLRVRGVDLAGNSRSADETAVPSAALLPGRNSSFLYRRFEPVDAPVLVPRAPFHEGESLERIVLRTPADPAIFFADHPDYLLAGERHLVPPKTTQFVAESHGRFDRSIGASPEAKANVPETYAIGLQETGSLNDRGSSTRFIPFDGSADATGYAVHEEAQLRLPYLPDPIARGASFRNLPGMADDQWVDAGLTGEMAFQTFGFIAGSVARVAFGTDDTWPAFQPFRLRLATGAAFAGPIWDGVKRELIITLPPGEQIAIGLRSYLTPDDLDAMGMWGLVEEGLVNADGEQLNRIRIRAEAGDFWFVTPERNLTLTHAVQRPLRAPELAIPGVHRTAGQTYAGIENRITIDARSTARIDLDARWTETIDPVTAKPVERAFAVHIRAQEIAKPLNADLAESVNPGRKERWDRKNTLSLTTFGAVEGAASASGDPVKPTGAPAAIDPADPRPPLRHEFGDTKHRTVRYQAVATTRFRDCFPKTIADDITQITRPGNEIEVIVPGSARPDAPMLLAALPAFRWDNDDTPSLDQSRSRAGGIRVYLDRPWFGSGAGEKLAVLLWAPDDGSWPPDARAFGSVTQWGRDPIWQTHDRQGRDFPVMPKQAHFPLRVDDPNGENRRYLLAGFEALGQRFAVAAHGVCFHQKGSHAGQASCDIQITLEGAYTPFVRLALARFQPFSVEGCHLSPVLLTDFIQLAPNRTVTLAPTGQPDRVRVVVSGDVAGAALDPAGARLPHNSVDVSLERRMPGTTDDAGWESIAFPSSPHRDPLPAQFDGTLWQGTIALPSPRTPGEYRLVIREYEQLSADDISGFQTTRRLVFADTILLPAP